MTVCRKESNLFSLPLPFFPLVYAETLKAAAHSNSTYFYQPRSHSKSNKIKMPHAESGEKPAEAEAHDGGFSTPTTSSEKTAQGAVVDSTGDLEKADEPKGAGANPDYVTGKTLYLLVASTSLACFLTVMDLSVISTVSLPCQIHLSHLEFWLSDFNESQAIPRITDDFNSLVDVGWYGSAYNLGR